MKRRLIMAAAAGAICLANLAYAKAVQAQAQATAASCSGDCDRHSDCTGDCICNALVFPPFPRCSTWDEAES